MPRLSNYSHRELRRGVGKLQLPFREGKERNAWYQLDGQAVFPVQLSKVHSGVVPIGTINALRQQLYLTTPQFQALIDCPLSGREYEALIRAKITDGRIKGPGS